MSSSILATAVALPAYSYSQDEIRGFVRSWLSHDPEKAAKADSILRNAEVTRRHTARPAEWYAVHRSVSERSEAYAEEMVRLCEAAARQALERAEVPAEGIGLIVSTSCTGVMIPPVESHLMNRMPFRPATRRMPLTELGCVAGATALAHADQYLRANPAEAVLVLSAELASLTAQLEDYSLTNIVAAAIFGDGAAAAVLAGAGHRALTFDDRGARPGAGHGAANGTLPRPRILATRSVQFPGTLDLMGFTNTDTGLKIFLSPRVPRFIREELPRHLLPFLADHGASLHEIRHFLLHPGGRKVLEGLQRELGLDAARTRLSWDVLRDHGNLSSATVLFLLNRFEREVRPAPGELGLMMAVGPGFACELILLQWQERP
jgi:predicted naringenin-chalcone synthase